MKPDSQIGFQDALYNLSVAEKTRLTQKAEVERVSGRVCGCPSCLLSNFTDPLVDLSRAYFPHRS